MERLGESVAALAGGEIGFAHLALIARTSAALGQRLDEAKLLGQARKLNVFPFRNRCTHARHAGDTAGFVNEEREGVEARSLTLTTADDGVVLVQGLLDQVGGAALRTALEPLAKRAGKYDDRDRERRMADALVDLSMHALDNGVPNRRPHLQVTTSLETLLGLSGAPAAEMEFSLPISSKAVERLACDCSWPGCDRPASWTSAHHVVHWTHGGSTDLPNLVLLCYRHHWMVHEGNWQIVRSDDGCIHTVPPLIGFETRSRGPD